ncbi:hypothetical protein V8E36_005069 [Tilletia maclaganii]
MYACNALNAVPVSLLIQPCRTFWAGWCRRVALTYTRRCFGPSGVWARAAASCFDGSKVVVAADRLLNDEPSAGDCSGTCCMSNTPTFEVKNSQNLLMEEGGGAARIMTQATASRSEGGGRRRRRPQSKSPTRNRAAAKLSSTRVHSEKEKGEDFHDRTLVVSSVLRFASVASSPSLFTSVATRQGLDQQAALGWPCSFLGLARTRLDGTGERVFLQRHL